MKNQIRGVLENFTTNFTWTKALLALGLQWVMWLIWKVNDIFTPWVWGLLGAYTIDAFTRWLIERKKGTWKSKPLREKFSKKAKEQWVVLGILIIVSTCNEHAALVLTYAYCYYIVAEIKSIKENLEEWGANIPPLICVGIDASQEALEQGRIPNMGDIIEGLKEEKGDEKDESTKTYNRN